MCECKYTDSFFLIRNFRFCLLKDLKIPICFNLCVWVPGWHVCTWSPEKSEGILCPGGVAGVCEPPWVHWKSIQVLFKNNRYFSCWAISPAPRLTFKLMYKVQYYIMVFSYRYLVILYSYSFPFPHLLLCPFSSCWALSSPQTILFLLNDLFF